MDIVDTKLRFSSSCILYGPSGSGKTELLLSILHPDKQETVFGERIKNIFYIFSIWQNAYDRLKLQTPEVKFIQSFSQVPKDLNEKHVVVWDDLQLRFQSDKKAKQEIQDVFFRLAHHRNMLNLVVLQTIHGHGLRNCVLNSQYQIFFPVKSDQRILDYVSRGMFPDEESSFLRKALSDAAKDKYGYIFLDKSPTQDERYSLRNFIYPIKGGKFYSQQHGKNSEK
jgi:energy-coupling factor transporter ATP-binding protein EcfA2